MASLAAWNRWKVKQYIRRYVREIEWLIRLFSVSFFSAPGFRLFSVNPGCTALAFERKIWKKQKGCPQREKYRRGRPLSMKILINTLFAGIKAKNKDGYLYQNNRPYMEKNPNNTKFRRFRGHLLWNWGHSWKCGVTSLTLIWPHFLRSPPPAAGHESFYSKSIQFFNCVSNRIEKQCVLSCRYLHGIICES